MKRVDFRNRKRVKTGKDDVTEKKKDGQGGLSAKMRTFEINNLWSCSVVKWQWNTKKTFSEHTHKVCKWHIYYKVGKHKLEIFASWFRFVVCLSDSLCGLGTLPYTHRQASAKEHVKQILHFVCDFKTEALANNHVPRASELLVHWLFYHFSSALLGNKIAQIWSCSVLLDRNEIKTKINLISKSQLYYA